MAKTRRARVTVSGRVQGVWFRAETRDMARLLGLSGWVRNAPDGTVEAVFEGEEAEVGKAVEWCRRGPRMARVDSVELVWEEPRGEQGFEVRYA